MNKHLNEYVINIDFKKLYSDLVSRRESKKIFPFFGRKKASVDAKMASVLRLVASLGPKFPIYHPGKRDRKGF